MEKNKRRFNRGTKAGKQLLAKSIDRLGCGRSVLADKNGVIIAGNDVYETAVALGKKLLTIETDGDALVVIKRTDVEAESKKGYELAFTDNLVQEKNLDWDADAILGAMDECIKFDATQWNGHSAIVKELDLATLLKDSVELVEKKNRAQDIIDESVQLSFFDL